MVENNDRKDEEPAVKTPEESEATEPNNQNPMDNNNEEEGRSEDQNNRIIQQVIEEEMKRSYIDYAMSVIVGRALPDVRDGLKPVHRRILYAMNDLNMRYNSPHKKSARIVGEVLGKYHPHGDSAVYDSLVRMAQDFSLHYPLIDGQGNWGSIDGDRAAAMRYTEARLAKIADELLQDIDKETIDFTENFDGSLKEPSVLPAKLPNLLINGSAGIAVGMATNIPPHNLSEIIDAIKTLIDDPTIELNGLISHVKGPDFPTGAIIAGKSGILQAYNTGRGHLKIKSVIRVEEKSGKRRIVITEIPYQVNKSQLVEQIAYAIREKRVEGVSDLRDESDRRGIRVVVELKRDANPEIVENQLMKHTRLQVTFGIIMLALVDGKPKVLNLKEMLEQYIIHRRTVVRRRCEFELKKAEARAHILEGLIIALQQIDEVVKLIKSAKNVDDAREGLVNTYGLTEIQVNAILDMKLQKLTGLEQEKIKDELKELLRTIEELQEILADEEKILNIIKEELDVLNTKYGDARKTKIMDADEELDLEDLIDPEEQVVMVSHDGYAKRMSLELYREQRRGGKGVKGATTKEEDFIEHIFIANTHDYLLLFTDKGKVYWKKVYSLPESARTAKGKALINLIKVDVGERVNAVIPIKEFASENLVFITKNGKVKKTALSEYSRVRQGGIRAITLVEGDSLVDVLKTDGEDELLLASARGQAIRFDERDCRPMGRSASGVRGIRLRTGDYVVGAIKVLEKESILTITENGYGKRSPIADYRLINRGGLGVRNIICSQRNGNVVAVKRVKGDEGLIITTKRGIVIRMSTANLRVIGRNTQGVRLMHLKENDSVVACAKIINNGVEEESSE